MLLTSIKLGAVIKTENESFGLFGGSDHVLLLSEYADPLNIGKKITRASLFMGKMSFEDGFWDLENSSADYMGEFEYYEQAKLTSKIGGYYKVPEDYDSWIPETETIDYGTAETAVFYINDTEFKRPLLDEGFYEHRRTALFRYSSFGEFDRVLHNLDKTKTFFR